MSNMTQITKNALDREISLELRRQVSMTNEKMRFADQDGKLILRDSDDYTPDERKGWGITADQIVDKPLPAKWDQETSRWRLIDHCRALVLEQQPRKDLCHQAASAESRSAGSVQAIA